MKLTFLPINQTEDKTKQKKKQKFNFIVHEFNRKKGYFVGIRRLDKCMTTCVLKIIYGLISIFRENIHNNKKLM